MREPRVLRVAQSVTVALLALAVAGCARKTTEATKIEPENTALPGYAVGKDLDPATRPVAELDRFKDVDCTSVTEYFTNYNGAFSINRVHRFTYKADYEEELVLWQEIFPESEGWIVEYQISNEIIIAKDYRDGKVASHAMILEPGTYKYDEKMNANTLKVEDYDYVRVAMNEYHWPEQSEPYESITLFNDSLSDYIDIPVPSSAHFDSWEKAGRSITFNFKEEPDTGLDAYQMIEVWYKSGDRNYVAIVQISKDFPLMPGLEGVTRDEAVLIDSESIVRRLPVEFDGRSVTIVMPDAEGWELCVAISRWCPVEVESPYNNRVLSYFRVSSIEMAPEKQPFANPNLWRFYRPLIDTLN